jgi:hypothetical protein
VKQFVIYFKLLNAALQAGFLLNQDRFPAELHLLTLADLAGLASFDLSVDFYLRLRDRMLRHSPAFTKPSRLEKLEEFYEFRSERKRDLFH